MKYFSVISQLAFSPAASRLRSSDCPLYRVVSYTPSYALVSACSRTVLQAHRHSLNFVKSGSFQNILYINIKRKYE